MIKLAGLAKPFLKETVVNPEVAKAYSAVYSLTDKHGDEALEVMNQYVDQEGLTDALAKHLDDKKLSPKESKELIAVLNDVAGEFGVKPKTATKGFDQAFNVKKLKNINFILPPWDSVDAMFKKGDWFDITFNDKVGLDEIRDVLQKIQRKEKSVAAMEVNLFDLWDKGEIQINVRDGNYAGLTYLLAALDDLYGKAGASMGWN